MARNFVDNETGEILQEPEFIKVYIRDLCNVKGISGRQMDVFIFMLSNMNDHNEVNYGLHSKKRFLEKHNTTNAVFNNTVKHLIDAGLIERLSKGEFRVNKKYAVRVEWSKVQSIEWTTRYTKDGKVENVNFN